jgi:hypothetical protein
VLDGLGAFATHLLFLSPGRVRCFGRCQDIPELAELAGAGEHDAPASPLHRLCERWMAEDRRTRKEW